jgi:hypothetical protein
MHCLEMYAYVSNSYKTHLQIDPAVDILSFEVIDIYTAPALALVPVACRLAVLAPKLVSALTLRYANNHELFDSAPPSVAISILVTVHPSVVDLLGCFQMVVHSFPSFSVELWQMLSFAFWIFFVGHRG